MTAKPEEKYLQQVLKILLRMMMVLTLISAASTAIFRPDFFLPTEFEVAVLTLSVVLYAIAYFLNEHDRYQSAVFLTIMTVFFLGHILNLPVLDGDLLMPLIMVAVFIGGILLSVRATLLMMTIMTIWSFFWFTALADWSFVGYFTAPFALINGIAALTLAVDWYHAQVRRDRIQQDEKYSMIFNASRSALLITDGQQVTECNHVFQETFGYLDRAVPATMEAIFGDQWDTVQQHLADGDRENIEATVPRSDASSFPATINISKLEEFTPLLYLLSIRDITELQEAEQARLQLDTEKRRVAMLEEFIGEASHDLKNPLTTIGTSLYLLRRRFEIPPDNRHMRVVEQEIEHLANLFDDLLALPRLENSNFRLKPEQTPLADLVRDEVEKHAPMAAQGKHTLNFHPPETDLEDMEVDRTELRRALRQLITNAIKYTPNGGTIDVRVYQSVPFCVIEVQDNGSGMTPEVVAHIFERFYRGNSTTNTVKDGLGVGLSIVRRVMEAHGGEVRVESEPDKGSTFRLCLPAAVASQV